MDVRLWNDAMIDTRSAPLKLLITIVFLLHRRGNLVRVMQEQNGRDFELRFVRALRARMFADHDMPKGRLLAILNRLDPPACRCGKPGTRIVGSITFCRKCGPPESAAMRNANVQERREARSALTSDAARTEDYRTLSHESLRLSKRKGFK